jgi:Protein ENHANCED DISEASE RESISTANCE 2, C-terminal
MRWQQCIAASSDEHQQHVLSPMFHCCCCYLLLLLQVPALLVVNVQLPLEEPSMLRSQSDGATLHCVFYFTMSAATAQQLSSAATSGSSSELSPSLQLLCDYCSRAESDAEMRGRFKTMATVNNIEAVSSHAATTAATADAGAACAQHVIAVLCTVRLCL